MSHGKRFQHFRQFSTRKLKQIMRTAEDKAMRMMAYGILIEREAFKR